MRKALAAVVFGCVGLFVAGAEPARADNMADALVGAYNTSGLLEQNRALLRAADEDVAQAVATLRPILSWTASAGRTVGDLNLTGVSTGQESTPLALQLSLQYLLYDFGASRQSIRAAEQTVLATRESLTGIEQQVLFNAVLAYLNLILQQEYVELAENNNRVLEEQLKATQDRFDVGAVTRTDVALAQAQLAGARANLTTARGDYQDARAAYQRVVGRLPNGTAGLPPLPKKPASVDQAIAVAVNTHPDIRSAQYQIASAEFLIERAEASMLGSLSVNGSAGLNNNLDLDRDGHSGSVTLSFNQPIYQGGALSSGVRQAKANRDAARGSLITAQRTVVESVRNAYEAIGVAASNIQATSSQVDASKIAFDGLREEAKLGSRTTLDVLIAEQDLLDARSAQITARIALYQASYQLLQTQGLLTAQRLQLPVTIYDPSAYYNLAKTAPTNISKRGQQLDRVLEALGKQ
ncbi:TolC family outer membrane protein [Chachezhania antarctica]|uniref:TolC family outer membrane protein n=1 Tax=Chachezhania antarctica TaxID=2340860 RepID=UPI001F099956|nr:TolC family outer membrane protein [Chachezhania antarctica]